MKALIYKGLLGTVARNVLMNGINNIATKRTTEDIFCSINKRKWC
jgi:hypothetical protein